MTNRQKRSVGVIVLLLGAVLVVFLGVKTFQSNLLYYFSPSDIKAGKAPIDANFKIGGLVEKGSVIKEDLTTTFTLTDNSHSFVVKYTGILPDLFREEQGIIATGKLLSDVFIASEVLAKHDENYMPPEVAASLKNQK